MKTISIPEDLHKNLIDLKLDQKDKNMASLLKKLVLAYKERQFLDSSDRFRKMLGEKKITFNKFLKESRKVRGEIGEEWF